MRLRHGLALLIAIPLVLLVGGRVTSAAPVTTSLHTMVVGGLTRAYRTTQPARVPESTIPVIVLLHGRAMTPAAMSDLTEFDRYATQAVLVYPAGFRNSWNAGGCCGPADTSNVDDVTFLRQVVRSVLASVPGTDPARVYLVGYSNGGRMAFRMACADPLLFAAYVAVEAVPVQPCATPTPVRLMVVASTGDPLLAIPPGGRPHRPGGQSQPAVDDLITTWRRADGCPATSASSQVGTLRLTSWSPCAAGSQVEVAIEAGGSHAWPASATTAAWNFLTGP